MAIALSISVLCNAALICSVAGMQEDYEATATGQAQYYEGYAIGIVEALPTQTPWVQAIRITKEVEVTRRIEVTRFVEVTPTDTSEPSETPTITPTPTITSTSSPTITSSMTSTRTPRPTKTATPQPTMEDYLLDVSPIVADTTQLMIEMQSERITNGWSDIDVLFWEDDAKDLWRVNSIDAPAVVDAEHDMLVQAISKLNKAISVYSAINYDKGQQGYSLFDEAQLLFDQYTLAIDQWLD